MSIVIIGGHDRMASQYDNICRSYKCKLKLFTQISSRFKKTNWMSWIYDFIHKYCFT